MTCVQAFISKHYDYLSRLCVGYVGEELGDDLMHDICVTILEDNGEKYVNLCERQELMYYLIRVIKINAFSKTTRFYYKYKKHHEKETPTIEFDIFTATGDEPTDVWTFQRMNEANQLLQGLSWFDCEVFKIYYLHGHSLKSLSDATGIPKTTINQSLGRARKHIQKTKKEANRQAKEQGVG